MSWEEAKKKPYNRGFFHEGSLFADYISAVEGVTEAPLRYHLGTGLAVLGAILGRRVALRFGSYRLYTITPTILVGPSGIGKGEAMGVGRRLLKEVRTTIRGGDLVPDIWILQDEATPQAIVHVMTVNPWGTEKTVDDCSPSEVAIIAGEMATFTSKSGEKENMIPVLTKLLEQDDSYGRTLMKDLVKGPPKLITDPTVSFIGGTTVDWMRKMMPGEMFSGGFFRRCIMIVERAKGQHLDWPDPLDASHIRKMAIRWNAHLKKIGVPDPGEKTVWFNADGIRSYYAGFKKKHEEKYPTEDRLVGHFNSYPQHVLRTACSFAISQGTLTLTPEHVREAEAFVTSLAPDLRIVLLQEEAHGFRDQAQLLERLVLDRPHTMGELRRKIPLPKRQFEDLIQWGIGSGVIQEMKKDERDRLGFTVAKVYKSTEKRRDMWARKQS